MLVLSETVLVLVIDGCSNCGDSDRGSRRFAVTCEPMGRIAILDCFGYEYEYRDAEYEYEKKHEQCCAPKSPPVLSWFFESWSAATSVTTGVLALKSPPEDYREMTENSRDFLRCNGYVVVGLLAGLAIGLGLGPRLRDFLISNGWPNESIMYIAMSLVLVSTMLNGFLYQGLKKDDYRKSVPNPSAKSEVDH